MGGKTTTQSNEPWGAAKPALETTLKDAGKLYEQGIGGRSWTGMTNAPMTTQQTGGLDHMMSTAQGFQPWLNTGANRLDNVANASTRDPNMAQSLAAMQAHLSGYGAPDTGQINAIGNRAQSDPYARGFQSLASGAQNDPFRERYSALGANSMANPALQGFASMSGQGGPSFSEQNLSKIASGGLLNGGDPNFERALEAASRKAADAVNMSASGAGRYGGGIHQGNLAREVGDLQANARVGQYNTERGRQVEANSLIDSQRNMGDQTRLSALGGLGNTYGSGVGQALNAAQAGTSSIFGGMDRALNASQAGSNAYQTGLGNSLNAFNSAADIQGRNADRRIGATNDLFNMSQAGVGNQINAFDRMNSAYDMALRPGQTSYDVGQRYQDQAQNVLNDQMRIFDDTQNQPWNQLARYNAIAQGMGGLGGTQTARSGGGFGDVLGGLLGVLGGMG